MANLLVIITICISVVVTVNSTCNFPPHMWCSSPEISKSCKVWDQCQAVTHQSNASPVDFTLYYESLCPDCKIFFKEQLSKAYNKVGSIMNLTLVPYGNAEEHKRGDKWKFECQHGKQECVGNMLETCAIYVLKNVSTFFPFIECMEKSSKLPEDAAKQCAQQLQVDLSPIMDCYNGPLGNKLEHQMALQTNALNPSHQYVPWVTVNGVHTEAIQKKAEKDLVKLICDTYLGPKPPGCTSVDLPLDRKCRRKGW